MTTDDESPGGDDGEVRRQSLLDRPKAADQVYQAYPNQPQHYGLDEKDGLPKPVIPSSLADAIAPSLSHENLVCMADESAFVVRDEWSREIARFDADSVLVRRLPDGRRVVQGYDLYAMTPSYLFAFWYWLWGLVRALFGDPHRLYVRQSGAWYAPSELVEVEPVRPQCRHYARQLQDFPQAEDALYNIRICTARRVDYGDFMSLNDQRMMACELREPSIGNNRARIEEFDRVVIARGREQVERDAAEDEEFDIEQALDDQPGGIFK